MTAEVVDDFLRWGLGGVTTIGSSKDERSPVEFSSSLLVELDARLFLRLADNRLVFARLADSVAIVGTSNLAPLSRSNMYWRPRVFFFSVARKRIAPKTSYLFFYLENLLSGLEGVVRNWRWVKSLARRRGSRTRRRSISVSVAAFSSKSEVSSCCRVTVKAASAAGWFALSWLLQEQKKKKTFLKNLSVTHYGRTNVDWASPHAMPHHLIVSAVCRYTFSCAREKKSKNRSVIIFLSLFLLYIMTRHF